MKWINYHHLIYFKTIAAHGSVSKAAEYLRIGQPALSSQLKNLEDYLGVQLFERKNRRLILTEPGKIALEYANQISSLGQELIQVIDNKTFTQKIHLSVGALDSIPKHLICDIVDLAHKKTGCFLSILEGSMDNLIRELTSHKIEIIISDHETSSLKYDKVFSKKILSKPIIAYASPKFSNLKKNFPLSLNNAPCILPTSHSKLRTDVEHFFHSRKINPKIVAETQDTALQKILASKDDGVIFLPQFTTKELVQHKSLIRLGQISEVHAEYYIIYNKRIIENKAANIILSQDFEKMKLGH